MPWTLTSKMAFSFCQNCKTLQILDISATMGDLDSHLHIIKNCQELKEVTLPFFLQMDLQFVANNIAPNVEKLNLSTLYVKDNHVKILLGRCNKIKALHLGATLITDESLRHIRENLNVTLEELSLCYDDDISSNGILELKSMSRLKLLNLKTFANDKDEDIESLRHQLPRLMIASYPDHYFY